MSKRGPFLFIAGLWLTGCAALLQPDSRPGPDRIAARGLAALEEGDYQAGLADLTWVSTHYPDRAAGRHALLALAAALVNPANPVGSLDDGAEVLATFRALPDNPPWTAPLANSLRGLLLELRDARDRTDAAERARAGAEQSAREASERAQTAAEKAAAREAALEEQVADLERQLEESQRRLAAARAEVARMRRTLGG
jgi:hypothetical protein